MRDEKFVRFDSTVRKLFTLVGRYEAAALSKAYNNKNFKTIFGSISEADEN